jgi:hypothetical protein
MPRQTLITSLSFLNIKENQPLHKNSIIGCSVVINAAFDIQTLNNNYITKTSNIYHQRRIIQVKNTFEPKEISKEKDMLENSDINFHQLFKFNENFPIGHYLITSYNLFFSKQFIYKVLLNKDFINLNKIFIFDDLDWKGLVQKFKSLNISLSAGSTVLRHSISPVQLNLIKFILDIESEEYSAEWFIKNTFNLNKIIHKKNLIETFSKDHKIWLIRETFRLHNIKIINYMDFCILLYLHNKYLPHLVELLFDQLIDVNYVKQHIIKMKNNPQVLSEYNSLDIKNFSLTLKEYDLNHKLINKKFNNLNELNKAIENFKNN